jgi:K+-sensing histidine kinase KdpD
VNPSESRREDRDPTDLAYARLVHDLHRSLQAAGTTLEALQQSAGDLSAEQRRMIGHVEAWIADAEIQLLRGTHELFGVKPRPWIAADALDGLRRYAIKWVERFNTVDRACFELNWNRESRTGAWRETINIDFDAMRIVLSALLANVAAYAVVDGLATAYISASIDEEFLRLTCRDEGPGIDPDDRAQIFDAGYRAFAARASMPNGLGQGLYDARRRIAALDGTLELADSPTGALFEILLPVRKTPT